MVAPRSLNELLDDLTTAEQAVKSVKQRLCGVPKTVLESIAALEPVEDESAYRPATEFLGVNRFKSYRQLLAALKSNPWIRTKKPSRFRLKVHAGDLIAYVARMNMATFEAADVSASTAAEFAEAVRRTRPVRIAAR
jgi:predicted DNA-binding protein (UPF0278 family)